MACEQQLIQLLTKIDWKTNIWLKDLSQDQKENKGKETFVTDIPSTPR